MRYLKRLKTFYLLGLINCVHVAVYKISLRYKVHRVIRIYSKPVEGTFFKKKTNILRSNTIPRSSWKNGSILRFGLQNPSIRSIPLWHFKTNDILELKNTPWWCISDFDQNLGDIKETWEMSRFDWLIAFSQRAAMGNAVELDLINSWLNDWCKNNTPYLGPNWKCGQEAAIRVIHLALTAKILDVHFKSEKPLLDLIRAHLARIEPTVGYALGQSNNHATSEGAALFIGGVWLAKNGCSLGKDWAVVGRKILEDSASKLIESDGTFSQYSTNYHRLLLDTYSFAEVWRREFKIDDFSPNLISKLSVATDWMAQMVDPHTGFCPNIGANDGAKLIVLDDADYRDFRSSLQLATVLFQSNRRYVKSGIWDQPLYWLGIQDQKTASKDLRSVSFDKGGFHILRNQNSVAYLRYPRYHFRPSQADALHVDLWIKGVNILRDAGTYSYHSKNNETEYFNGTGAHNTIQFDDRDQMPRLGRFLFGDWLKCSSVGLVTVKNDLVKASAAYRDGFGATHKREIKLYSNKLVCLDEISGFQNKAVLRWRLPLDKWILDKSNSISNGEVRLTFVSNLPPEHIFIASEFESLYYKQKKEISVATLEFSKSAKIKTMIEY